MTSENASIAAAGSLFEMYHPVQKLLFMAEVDEVVGWKRPTSILSRIVLRSTKGATEMATVEYWIQLENRPWDACPNNVVRMMGQTIEEHLGVKPVTVTLTSPETGVVNERTMYLPVNGGTVTDPIACDDVWLAEDALIYRRYTENWAEPDDRKINPWDLNEPDPTDSGTMGTIPGATLECSVGDKIVVHLRNKDYRPEMGACERSHSMHPHGIAFAPEYDGAYPLSPPDRTQPIPADEAAAWAAVGVTAFKQGDRIPPDGTFTYTWDTFGWPATAGVWHYHDHRDDHNVILGAVGFLVIHNPDDPDDVITQDLPNGAPNGSLTDLRCIDLPDFPFPTKVLPEDVTDVRVIDRTKDHAVSADLSDPAALSTMNHIMAESGLKTGEVMVTAASASAATAPERALVLDRGVVQIEFDPGSLIARSFCFRVYTAPPEQAQYLQYYHELPGVGMTINGRRFMGNSPTLIGGTSTKMRFGVAAMNNATFHTFHLHGHRWTVPGPDGNSSGAIESSVQNTAISQFEDTRILGPANSFGFTIDQGSFMGARFTPDPERAPGVGEWHMHCHVLSHMMPGGMMGSLKVIQGGELFLPLPQGEPCGDDVVVEPTDTVVVDDNFFAPNILNVAPGTMVTFDFSKAFHTVTTVSTTGTAVGIEVNGGTGPIDDVPAGTQRMVVVTGAVGDEINYQCGIHGASMTGKINLV